MLPIEFMPGIAFKTKKEAEEATNRLKKVDFPNGEASYRVVFEDGLWIAEPYVPVNKMNTTNKIIRVEKL
jgi:hypothetical protein